MIKIDSKLLVISLFIMCILSIIRFFNNINFWLADIVSNFPVQYAFASMLLMIAFLWKRRLSLALFAGLLLLINISVLSDSGATARAAAHEDRTFNVYSVNICKTNRDFQNLVLGLKKTDADILLLLEVTVDSIKPLQELVRTYPYQLTDLNIGAAGTGAVLMSRFPILDSDITYYSDYGNILIDTTLEINNRKIKFYGVHMPRPAYIDEFSSRSQQFVSLANTIKKQSLPVIVAGDLNATPYSPIYRDMVAKSGLKDSSEGFGWQPSWPTSFPLLWLPIDHILVSPGMQVHNRATGSYISSDHYPVFAELSIL